MAWTKVEHSSPQRSIYKQKKPGSPPTIPEVMLEPGVLTVIFYDKAMRNRFQRTQHSPLNLNHYQFGIEKFGLFLAIDPSKNSLLSSGYYGPCSDRQFADFLVRMRLFDESTQKLFSPICTYFDKALALVENIRLDFTFVRVSTESSFFRQEKEDTSEARAGFSIANTFL